MYNTFKYFFFLSYWNKYTLLYTEMSSSPKEKVYSKKIMQKNVCDEGSTELFLLKQPTPIGFIYSSPSGQSCDNIYVTQEAYNSSYKLALNDIISYSITENEESKIDEKNISAEVKDTCIGQYTKILYTIKNNPFI